MPLKIFWDIFGANFLDLTHTNVEGIAYFLRYGGLSKTSMYINKGGILSYSGSNPFFMAFCLSCCFCLSLSSLS